MEKCWSYNGKYLGKFVRYGTASYHHEPEQIFEYGTVYGNVKCIEVPKKYSWDEIVAEANVSTNTISYFIPIYAGLLYSHTDFLEIVEEMRDEQRHKQQLEINQQAVDNLDDSFKPIIQNIIHPPKL